MDEREMERGLLWRQLLASVIVDLQVRNSAIGGSDGSTMFHASDWEKFDPVRFSEIARVFLVCPIVPMFVYAEAAASDAVAFRIIESLRGRVIRQGRFAQVVIGIGDIRKIGPFRSEKIEADGIDRYAVKGHKYAVRPSIVEWRHLPLAMRRTIDVIVSIEAINNKKGGFLAEVFMTQIICERGVTCRTIAVVMETVVCVLVPVGVDTGGAEQILRAKCHP